MFRTDRDSELMDILLDFGEAMMESGAEIARIEDSLARMGVSYGAEQTNVFVITSSIELTVRFDDGQTLTRTRRIHSGGIDFERLRLLNALSRQCAMQQLEIDQLREEVNHIRNRKMSKIKLFLGSAFAAGGFAVFFGGTLLDAAVAALVGLAVCVLQQYAYLSPNKVFFYFISALLSGAAICLVSLAVPMLHIDKVIIGDIMLLIPGIAITMAVKDVLIGDTISGLTKLADCLVWAGALAAGFMIVIGLFAR